MGGLLLLMLAGVSVGMAFPSVREVVVASLSWRVAMGVFGVILGGVGGVALWRRRWLSALFHLGGVLVIIGGLQTARLAREEMVWLPDVPAMYLPVGARLRSVMGEAEPMVSSRRREGDELMSLLWFKLERYANGMPRQYRTMLRFPEGKRELSVNRPLRRKGVTYYQMSYAPVADEMGQPMGWQTGILVRRDPGWRLVLAGYGVLALAALGLALREEVRG